MKKRRKIAHHSQYLDVSSVERLIEATKETLSLSRRSSICIPSFEVPEDDQQASLQKMFADSVAKPVMELLISETLSRRHLRGFDSDYWKGEIHDIASFKSDTYALKSTSRAVALVALSDQLTVVDSRLNEYDVNPCGVVLAAPGQKVIAAPNTDSQPSLLATVSSATLI